MIHVEFNPSELAVTGLSRLLVRQCLCDTMSKRTSTGENPGWCRASLWGQCPRGPSTGENPGWCRASLWGQCLRGTSTGENPGWDGASLWGQCPRGPSTGGNPGWDGASLWGQCPRGTSTGENPGWDGASLWGQCLPSGPSVMPQHKRSSPISLDTPGATKWATVGNYKKGWFTAHYVVT